LCESELQGHGVLENEEFSIHCLKVKIFRMLRVCSPSPLAPVPTMEKDPAAPCLVSQLLPWMENELCLH
jgi:hypothetical protein